jgi:broad specificity phosphatase PhoE
MKLILVRHGETVENVKGICQGQSHGTLSKKGISQAKKVAKALKNEKIDVAYSSDLRRAFNTAKEIMKYHKNVKLVPEKQLREKNQGVLTGKHHAFRQQYLIKKGVKHTDELNDCGEKWDEVKDRAINFYNKICKKYANETVLIVTHGGIIASILLHLKGWGWERYKDVVAGNTAYSVISVNGKGKHRILIQNCTDHLCKPL